MPAPPVPRLASVTDSPDETTIEWQLSRRRIATAAAWALTDEIVLIGAGEPIAVPGRGDVTYPFRAHSEYFYLTDRNRPGGTLAFDPQEGWVDFVAPITAGERLWSGARADAADGVPADALQAWVASRRGRRIACLGAPPTDAPGDPELTDTLRFGLSHVRRVKDPVELERMYLAERATSAGFAAVVASLSEGMSEREAQIELEAEVYRHGGDAMAYDTIVGSGPNAAVLHVAPSSRRLRPGELVLIDAGAERDGYASDITRTYPVSGELSSEQLELHSLVHTAQQEAIALCTAGREWREVHVAAARVIADGLVAVGLLRGAPDTLLETGAVWLFFPHGIGHLVGLGVRDAGGTLPERRANPPPFPNLRIDLPLRPGMVVTVEPGIYFIPAILADTEQRRRHARQVAWDRVDRMLAFGGIRIEDNVLVTEHGHQVITGDVPLLG
jgi:Xaa-Pro aminopeptidase